MTVTSFPKKKKRQLLAMILLTTDTKNCDFNFSNYSEVRLSRQRENYGFHKLTFQLFDGDLITRGFSVNDASGDIVFPSPVRVLGFQFLPTSCMTLAA